MRKFFASIALLGVVASFSSFALPSANAETVVDRVCVRVVKNFSIDTKMWDRVNERIEKRFGIRCERSGGNSQQTSRSSSSSVRQSTQGTMQYWTTPQQNECTESAWTCTSWSGCGGYTQYESRKCEIDLEEVVKCLNPDAAKPSTQQKCDLSVTSTIANYNTMVKNQTTMDSQLPYYSGTTSTQLFQLSSQYATQVALMKVYYDKAMNKTLLPADNSAASSIVQTANALLDRFNAIADAENKIIQQHNQQLRQQQYQNQLQQQQYQNQLNQQNEQQHEQMCSSIIAQAALSGAWGSSAVQAQLYRAGCISLQQYCNQFLGLASAPAECR